MGTVYFLKIDEDPTKVKIGFTAGHVESRIRALQVGCPFKLKYVGGVVSNGELEKVFHCLCREQKISGEWFKIEGLVIDIMQKLMVPVKIEGIKERIPKRKPYRRGANNGVVGRPRKEVKDEPWKAAGKTRTTFYRHLKVPQIADPP